MRASLLAVVGKVVVKTTLHMAGLGGVWTVFEEMPELCKEVFEEWTRQVPLAEGRRVDLEKTAQAGDQDVEDVLNAPELQAVLDEVPPENRAGVAENARAFLRQVPGTAKQMFRREEDPTGQTVPASLVPRNAAELEPILQVRKPHFRAGDRPIAGADWELEELLGIGGFGEVWKARHIHSEREPRRALKFCVDDDAKVRLRTVEFRNCEIVRYHGNHPGIVRLLDTNLSADPPCLHFEYVEGGDLGGLVRHWKSLERYPSPLTIADVMLRIARPVAFAHRLTEQLVHRDLKPSNILVARSENGQARFKITDFGIGGIANEQVRREMRRSGRISSRSHRALSGSGTPLYASPEQIRGENASPTDDVHALGVLWYQLLVANLSEEKPTGDVWKDELRAQGMPGPLVKVLIACFEKAANRPRDAQVLVNALASFAPGEVRPRVVPSEPTSTVWQDAAVAAQHPFFAASPAPVESLPPVPEAVRQLETRSQSLRNEINAIDSGTHPNQLPAQLEYQRSSSAQGRPFVGIVKRMVNEFKASGYFPRSNAEWCALEPNLPIGVVIPVIESARLQDRLESELAEVQRGLLAGQEADFRNLIAQSFANRSEGDFPISEWLAVADQVRRRGYRFASTDQELLQKAEAVYRELTDEPRDWKRAESSGKVEPYVTFAGRYPESPRATLARERASEMLRAQLRKTPFVQTVRDQYLNVRSEALKARDRVGSESYGPWAFVAVLVALGVAAGCSVALVPFFSNGILAGLSGGVTTSILCASVLFSVLWRSTKSESKEDGMFDAVLKQPGSWLRFISTASFSTLIAGAVIAAAVSWVSSPVLGAAAGLLGPGVSAFAILALIMATDKNERSRSFDDPLDRFVSTMLCFMDGVLYGGCLLTLGWFKVGGATLMASATTAAFLCTFLGGLGLVTAAGNVREKHGPLPWWYSAGEPETKNSFYR